MNVNLDYGSTAVIVGAVAVVLLISYFSVNSELIDPTNENNLANQGFKKMTGAVFGTTDPGGAVYDSSHNGDGKVDIFEAPFWFLDKALG